MYIADYNNYIDFCKLTVPFKCLIQKNIPRDSTSIVISFFFLWGVRNLIIGMTSRSSNICLFQLKLYWYQRFLLWFAVVSANLSNVPYLEFFRILNNFMFCFFKIIIKSGTSFVIPFFFLISWTFLIFKSTLKILTFRAMLRQTLILIKINVCSLTYTAYTQSRLQWLNDSICDFN